jgi:hypothetical protein
MGLWVMLAGALVSVGHAASPPVASHQVELKAAIDSSVRSFTYVRLKSGEGSLPFNTESGSVKVRHASGKLQIDLNGDGLLDPQDGPAVGKDETFTLPIACGGKTIDVQLSVVLCRKNVVGLSSKTVLEGKVDHKVYRLVDQNVNGEYGERKLDSLLVDGGPPQPVTGVMDLSDGLAHVRFTKNGGVMAIEPYAGPTASMLLTTSGESWHGALTLEHVDGDYICQAETGQRKSLLPGAYRVARSVLSKRASDADEATRPQTFLHGGKSPGMPEVAVKSGENTLRVGAPFSLRFDGVRLDASGKRVKINSVTLAGAAGEQYRATVREGSKTSVLECAVRAGEQYESLSKMEYG